MAAIASGIDETSNAVQLNGFFGKTIYFLYNSFSQSATLPVNFICFFICQSTLFILQFFSPEHFQFKVLV